ncbi:MAG: sulfatase [Mucilaginibacter polytrichastri]|nr:sulfatase [Mucilaginibacter polytrichastri]
MKHFILALLVGCSLSLSAQQKPNIIFIMADDLGSGELGCYGNTFNETPNLDKLAAGGIRFTQAYAAAPVCSPTRASIMTGQYPARVGITDYLPDKSPRFLDPARYVTLNEALGKAGYHTGIVGKWHLDTQFDHPKGNPKQHGFDEVIASETKYIADGDYFFPYDKNATLSSGEAGEYLTDRQNAEAMKFIDRNKAKPFFLYLTYYSVHTKLDAPEALVKKYKQKFDAKYGAGEAEKVFGPDNKRHEADHADNPYLAAMIERIDVGVGEIMETLTKNGLDKNTLVVFFSDNGSPAKLGNNQGLRMGKAWLYEGGIRENLIMHWPAKIKGENSTDVPVYSTDFYSTFLAVAGTKPDAGIRLDGLNILPLITAGTKPDRDTFYWHFPSETGHWKSRMATAVRKGDWKLLYFYQRKQYELYDLKTDQKEEHDLATANPAKVQELKALMDAWKKEVKAEEPDLLTTKKAE